MVDSANIKHLSREDIVKNGSIFTPQYLVSIVSSLLAPYINENSVIGDFGSGYGAFLQQFADKGKRCFATDYDEISCELLRQEYPQLNIYNENSLLGINRDKYNLSKDDELIVVGNPPYNDVTSQYKKGEKGDLVCDEDVLAKDFGVSFLRAYDKLKAKYVCVLHPLAYLIKKNNFSSLSTFRDNYRLLKAVIFSSQCFESIVKTNAEFPVVAALYERNALGMNMQFIESFEFDIYQLEKKFSLWNISTIDKKVNKYPKKGEHNGLQFYTMRDINALMRNATFVEGNIANGVEVPLENLYQYGWVLFFKNNFNAKGKKFLYGNLSPLYPKDIDSEFKNAAAYYALRNHPLVEKYYSEEMIAKVYGEEHNSADILEKVLSDLYLF